MTQSWYFSYAEGSERRLEEASRALALLVGHLQLRHFEVTWFPEDDGGQEGLSTMPRRLLEAYAVASRGEYPTIVVSDPEPVELEWIVRFGPLSYQTLASRWVDDEPEVVVDGYASRTLTARLTPAEAQKAYRLLSLAGIELRPRDPEPAPGPTARRPRRRRPGPTRSRIA